VRAFVITGPGNGEVQDVTPPEPRPGQVVVDVERAGVCGTDIEFFTGEMSYLHTGQAEYPIRIGHEWAGTVSAVGDGVDPSWTGRRVTGDTMLGCGQCARCVSGRQHVCADRYEIGVRNGWPGALAEQLPVPVKALHALPDTVDAALGALVEPGGNALRAVWGAGLQPGERLLVLGPGAIGLLAAKIGVAQGAEVHLLGRSTSSTDFAASIGFGNVWTRETLPDLPYDAVIDASNAAVLPALAADLVEPGRRVVYIGLAGEPSLLDTRTLALKDVTAVGVLSASGGIAGTVEIYASGAVDPRPLIAATVGLDDIAAVLAGEHRPEWGDAPKIQVDPRR
jgi:threonine dehydrogenase-like Zn-dependent dehydrogenase